MLLKTLNLYYLFLVPIHVKIKQYEEYKENHTYSKSIQVTLRQKPGLRYNTEHFFPFSLALASRRHIQKWSTVFTL